jgi:hypothetical protein
MKKILNEDNQIYNFISSYGSGSGSTSQKVKVPTVPVPQHWLSVIILVTKSYLQHNIVKNACEVNYTPHPFGNFKNVGTVPVGTG